MRRHIASRLLLSFLLLWQVAMGMFAHAHGVAAMDTRTVATGTELEPTLAEHCPDHAAKTVDVSMKMPAVTPARIGHDPDQAALQNETYPDDCSMLCDCPCVQALALFLTLPHVPTARPDAQPAQVVTAPHLHAGISGLFRPPI